jgi:hypothetical protein
MERGRATSLSYATSKSPLGPFVHRGVIVDNVTCDPASWNNHGSIECVGGRWYVFHHRSSRNSQRWRRLCVEPIEFDAAGLIAEVPMSSQGVGPPFGAGEPIDAWRACELGGEAWIGPDEEGHEVLQGLTTGDTAAFRWVKLERPATQLDIDGHGDGLVEIGIAGGRAPIGEARVVAGATVDGRLDLPPGRHDLRLHIRESTDLRLATLVLR